jgi:hypothetical protein
MGRSGLLKSKIGLICGTANLSAESNVDWSYGKEILKMIFIFLILACSLIHQIIRHKI